MLKVQVKICGITNLADARYCAAIGADYLGFIMYTQSPRFVDPEVAQEIIEWVAGPRSVGVFVDDDPDTINRLARETGFDLVQLHGDETPDFCRSIEHPVIKAIRIKPGDLTYELQSQMEEYAPYVASFLLDTHVEGVQGGTGVPFNWRTAAALSSDYPLFVAGGINPSNVLDAVKAIKPVGVDVSSGVEELPGRKSFEKIDALVAALEKLEGTPSDTA